MEENPYTYTDEKPRKLGRKNGKNHWGFLVDSPDDGGFYVEIWHENIKEEPHTEICDTPTQAWQKAKELFEEL